MSKSLFKQRAQKPAETGARHKAAGKAGAAETPVIEQVALIEEPGRQSRPSILPDHSTAEEEDDD